MAKLPPAYFNHSQKVCSLYKRAVRLLAEYHIDNFAYWRYVSVLMRERFDKNKHVKDPRIAKMLLLQGEQEYKKKLRDEPMTFITSPGGLAYERYVNVPDDFLDYWHPWEKARYPKYFALREQRKKEYIEFYKKEYLNKSSDATKNITAKNGASGMIEILTDLNPVGYDTGRMVTVNLDAYKHCVEELKKYARERNITEEKTHEIFEGCFRRLELMHSNKSRKLFILLKIVCASFVLSIFSVLFVYNHPSYNSVLIRNLQTSIYPGLKFLRKLAVPVIHRFPLLTEVYDEWCLIENPYFYVSDMDCWPCSVVTSVPDLTGRNVSETFNFGIPFTRLETNAAVTFTDLIDVFHKHEDIFQQDVGRVSSNEISYRNVQDIVKQRPDLHSSRNQDIHITWRINRMRPSRVVRKLFGKPTETPTRWSQSMERFVFIDEANSPPYSWPNTECSNIVVKCVSGTRLIKMVPTAECLKNCKVSTVLLSQGYTLWYSWWYWRPLSLPVSNSTTITMMYLTSFC